MKPQQKTFSLQQRVNSFRFACDGLKQFFDQEHNTRIHLAGTIAAAIAAWWFHIPAGELIALVIVIGFVWAAEIFNTVIEKIMDHLSPDQHDEVRIIKDLSAGAVLIAALTALGTGLIIFIPKFL
ncbi:MAG: diacylglycerol kinase family protein [Chitinophagaceae bacterium]|nr:diacylglycerol kinase family protein [Chitinophagaceae bacterium]